ncbi:uncharacterized protein LOC109792053 [Cajanus cajan]|uniref:uncharacterized protein LOC109792053 n=1 Tax=Cajanus cajan TaxID=3821 RepID=UPI00098D8B9C|nr:uncharacterized protein LOC109792053 [Cajanus cajan]
MPSTPSRSSPRPARPTVAGRVFALSGAEASTSSDLVKGKWKAASSVFVVTLEMFVRCPVEAFGRRFRGNLIVLPMLEDEVLVSASQAEQLMRDDAECFMLFVALSVETERAITGIEIVSEFPDVFLDDVSGLPPIRDIEFSIDLVLGAGPVSVAPFRMALAELVELKKQIEDLLVKKMVRPSVSSSGAPAVLG